jgi:hypothetical protein
METIIVSVAGIIAFVAIFIALVLMARQGLEKIRRKNSSVDLHEHQIISERLAKYHPTSTVRIDKHPTMTVQSPEAADLSGESVKDKVVEKMTKPELEPVVANSDYNSGDSGN